MKKLGLTILFVFVLGYLAFLGWKIYSSLQGEHSAPQVQQPPPRAQLAPPKPAKPKTVVEGAENSFQTNPVYRESAETQVKWMKRGQQIALERFAGADRAEFRKTFYHRGFTYKPVACGEMQAWQGQKLLADFQRFIYVGTRLAYFENDVENFDVYWNKMCVETMDDPRP